MENTKYVAWSDASVRNNIGHVAFVVYQEGKLINEYCGRVEKINSSYKLELLGIYLLMKFLNENNISHEQTLIFTDFKSIPKKLSKNKGDLFNIGKVLLSKKDFKKYRRSVHFKHGRHNLAHKVSRKEYAPLVDYELWSHFEGV